MIAAASKSDTRKWGKDGASIAPGCPPACAAGDLLPTVNVARKGLDSLMTLNWCSLVLLKDLTARLYSVICKLVSPTSNYFPSIVFPFSSSSSPHCCSKQTFTRSTKAEESNRLRLEENVWVVAALGGFDRHLVPASLTYCNCLWQFGLFFHMTCTFSFQCTFCVYVFFLSLKQESDNTIKGSAIDCSCLSTTYNYQRLSPVTHGTSDMAFSIICCIMAL